MLEVRDLSVSYGQHRALEDVSVRVQPGEIVVILGANGAGKSTLLRTVGGLGEGTHSGTVEMDGHPVLGLPAHKIVDRGIALVPEGRGVFPDLTVKENLLLGAHAPRAREDGQTNLERIFGLFPKLMERRKQAVRTMSGGEQQMVAIGRAMMSAPSILMLDEPSLGLSPLLCKELFHSLTEVRSTGLGILLVEQNAKQSLVIADRGYLLENAHIVHEDTAANLANDPAVQKAYLGAGKERPSVVPPSPKVAQPAEPSPPERAGETERLPFVPTPAHRPETRSVHSANELIGGSIDELVRRASTSQAVQRRGIPVAPMDQSEYSGASNGLRTVLADIERAAADARRGRGVRGNGEANQEVSLAGEDRNPVRERPLVEIYRKPRVEIYRRSPGGKKLKRVYG